MSVFVKIKYLLFKIESLHKINYNSIIVNNILNLRFWIFT